MAGPSAKTAYISVGYNRASTGAACDDTTGIIAYAAGRFVALWDSQNAEGRGVYATLTGHKGLVTSVKHLPGGSSTASFISGDQSGEVRLWDYAERGSETSCVASIQAHKLSVSTIGVQAEASETYKGWFATGGSDSSVKVWRRPNDGEEGLQCVQTIELGGKLPLDLALSSLPGSDALVLCIACTDKKLQVWTWQAEKFEKSITLEGHEDWIRCLALTSYPSATSSNSSDLLLASGSQDGYVRLWRIAPAPQASVSPAPTVPSSVNKASDGELSAEMLDDFEKRLAGDDAEGSRQISTKAHFMAVREGDDIRKYNVTLEALLLGHEGWITDLHWSPAAASDSPILLTTSQDNSMIIWSPDTASAIWLNRHRFGEMGGRGLALFGALWGKDGKDVLAGGWNGGWSRWTRTIGPNEADVGPVDGAWEPATGVSGHTREVASIGWDPKQDYLISVSADQTSRIHAACSVGSSSHVWAEIARPQIHGYDMTDVAFINSMRFTSGADEKVVRVFDAPAGFVETLGSLGVTKGGEDISSRPKGATVPPLGLSNRALGRAPADDANAGLLSKGYNESHVSVSQQLDHLPTEDELSSSTLWPEIEKLYGHGYELIAVAASHAGDIVATACKATSTEHAAVRLYDTTSWKYVGEPLKGHSLTITRIAFSKDDRYILTSSRDRTWRMFERRADGTGYEPVAVAEKAHARIVWDCSWAADGACFATASRDKTAKIWTRAESASGWDAAVTIKCTEGTTAVDLIDQNDGSLVLAVGRDSGAIDIHTVTLAPAVTTELRLTIDPSISHVDHINRLSWRRGSQGLQLASCSEDYSVRVFDITGLGV